MFWDIYCGLCESMHCKPNTVAKELSISSGSVTKWKNGSAPSGDTLIKMADFFGCSVDYLLGRTDNQGYNNGSVYNVSNSPMSAQGCSNSVNIAAPAQQYDGMVGEMVQQFNTLSFDDKLEVMQMISRKAIHEE